MFGQVEREEAPRFGFDDRALLWSTDGVVLKEWKIAGGGRAVLDADLLQDFKAGLTGHVKVQNAGGQEMNVRFSLKGFSAALRALP